MAALERSAPLEIRAAGRTLTGEAIRYGVRATDRAERFEPGAFAPLGDVSLNLQHDPAIVLATTGDRLALTDTTAALEVRAELRPGAALTLLRRGSLSGLSVEFRCLSERRDGGMRVIERATLEGIGLVDTPSYGGRLEVRRGGRGGGFGGFGGGFGGGRGGGFGGSWSSSPTMRATVPADKKLRCECGGNAQAKWARIIPAAMQEMFDNAFQGAVKQIVDEAEGRAAHETVAVFGSYDRPLASVSRGTLRRAGRYAVDIDLPDDDNGRAVLAAHESAGVIVRPHLDMAESTYEQVGDTLIYSKAVVRAFVVSSTDAREGWPTPEILTDTDIDAEPIPEEELLMAVTPRRSRVWL